MGEYVRDLIRRDNERNEQAQFVRLQAELGKAFAATESFYQSATATTVIARKKKEA